MKKIKKYLIAETFVGAGGNHIGWKNNNFNTIYINDFDQNMLDTITYNNPELKNAYVDNDSILDIPAKRRLSEIGLKPRELDVLFGGIVCKGFSLAGERNPMDERNYFYHSQLNLVKHWKPKISVIENVSGILSAKVISEKAPKNITDSVIKIWKKIQRNKFLRSKSNKKNTEQEKLKLKEEFEILKNKRKRIMSEIDKKGFLISVIEDIENLYKKLGYRTYIKTLISSDFGAATTRKRVFIVAVRQDLKGNFKFPKKTHNKPTTVEEVLKGAKISKRDIDSIPMKHTKLVKKRFSYIPEGKNVHDIMKKLPKELKINSFFSRGSNMRLDSKKPAPTLVPGHSAFPLHPKEHRSITVREAALITGFPKNYKFFGNHSKRCEQVGNAIPPKLANAISKRVKKLLDSQ